MLEELNKVKGKIYGWSMAVLMVVSIGATTLMETGCAFLAAAQESAEAVRGDLDGVNSKILAIIDKLDVTKKEYDGKMRDIARAKEAGDIEAMDALVKQAMALKEAGDIVWNEYKMAEVERAQLKTAYDGAVARVEAAATKEEKWGSIFGSVLSGALSLLGLGGVGGAAAGALSARGSRRRADEFAAEADDYRDAAVLVTEALEKVKAHAPDQWATIKSDMLAKGDTAALKKIDEVRPGNTGITGGLHITSNPSGGSER